MTDYAYLRVVLGLFVNTLLKCSSRYRAWDVRVGGGGEGREASRVSHAYFFLRNVALGWLVMRCLEKRDGYH